MRSSAVIILSLCFLGTFVGIYGRDEDAIACIQELNIDMTSAEKDPGNELSHMSKDEQHCLMACLLKKRDRTSNTVHEVLMKQVKRKGAQLPEDFAQKMEQCKDKDNCEFIQCVDFLSFPFNLYFQI